MYAKLLNDDRFILFFHSSAKVVLSCPTTWESRSAHERKIWRRYSRLLGDRVQIKCLLCLKDRRFVDILQINFVQLKILWSLKLSQEFPHLQPKNQVKQQQFVVIVWSMSWKTVMS